MSLNEKDLLSLVNSWVTEEFVQKIAKSLGESPARVSAAIGAAVPALLAGLVAHGSTASGAESLLSQTRQGGFDRALTHGFTDRLAEGTTPSGISAERRSFLDGLLGDKLMGVARQIARSVGMSENTVMSVLGALAPIVLGVFGQKANELGGDPGAIASFLAKQKDTILAALPAGLSSIYGGFSNILGGATSGVSRAAQSSKNSGAAWLTAAAVILIAAGGYYLWKNRDRAMTLPDTTASSEQLHPVTHGIVDIETYANGNLDSPEKRVVMEAITFDTGSSNLMPASRPILDRLASILNTHPQLTARVEGHTDSTGDTSLNQNLSQERADKVRDELALRGVAVTRVQAKGMGASEPKAANDTEEGRAQNRRIEIVVFRSADDMLTH